jgi:ribonuclease PH
LVLGSAINCAVLALLDAGIAMRGILVATTCIVYNDDDRPGRAVVGDEDETTKYEEDNDNGVVESG